MSDQDEFTDFFLKIAILNCKLKIKEKFDKEQERQYHILKYLIKAFNTLENNDSITIDEIIGDDEISEINIPTESNVSTQNSKPKYGPVIPPYQSQYSYNYKSSPPVPVLEKIDDPEGDLAVKKMTEEALEQYRKIMSSRNLIISEKYDTVDTASYDTSGTDTDIASDTDTETESSEEASFLVDSDGEVVYVDDGDHESNNPFDITTNSFKNIQDFNDVENTSGTDDDSWCSIYLDKN